MKNNSYIVASLGRCGSQLMTEAIHNHVWGFLDHPKPLLSKTRPFIREYPEDFKNGTVYKTHLYPTKFPSNCRVIFTFGDPLDIVLSVLRKSRDPRWALAHFANLGADWNDFPKIMQQDVLNLENMFDAFYKKQEFDIMCARYETLWDHESEMSDFLEFDFKMPEKIERVSNKQRKLLSGDAIMTFEKGYSSLIKKINDAENLKIWSNKK